MKVVNYMFSITFIARFCESRRKHAMKKIAAAASSRLKHEIASPVTRLRNEETQLGVKSRARYASM